MERMYKFRREDTGEVIEVPWSVMIGQVGGFITLEDGVQAKRCVHLEDYDRPPALGERHTGTHKGVSDSLGFPQHQLEDFEKDRVENGFGGVEFKRDPLVPEFYQVHFDSPLDRERYGKHRGQPNHSSIGGVRFSEDDLRAAEELARRPLECQA